MEKMFIEVYQSSAGGYSLEITKERSKTSVGIDTPIEVATHLLIHERYTKDGRPQIHFTEGDHPRRLNPPGHDPDCDSCFANKRPLYTNRVPVQFEKAVRYYLNDKHLQNLCTEIEKELKVVTDDFFGPIGKKAEERVGALEKQIEVYGRKQDKVIRNQKARVYTMAKRQGA
jgi:hypothetical protein